MNRVVKKQVEKIGEMGNRQLIKLKLDALLMLEEERVYWKHSPLILPQK
jgi:hypothetical protein